ncbi:hypothetical protein M758_2G139500 [Ceratodon purpureus]|nr:hypothetical protein M758_2G139500 [Ceratodon purpureus]
MGSAAVANPTLSCHRFVALSHGISGAECPSTSNPKRTFFQRTGLLALPHRATSRHHSLRKRSTSSAATASHGLLEPSTSIDLDGIVAEAPTLLALSSDLDWQRSVTELREEALSASSAGSEKVVALERLGALMDGWLHENMFESIMQPSLLQGAQDPQEELGVRIRVEALRWQAALQAAEELANGVDRSFDWESEAAELRQCIVNQERAAFEQNLLNSWESSRLGMDKDAEHLLDEALKNRHTDSSYLTLFPDGSEDSSPVEHDKSLNKALEISGTWWTLGVLATAGLFGSQALDAIAADESVTAALTAATREAPGWVAPSVFAFPVVSYILFTLYRNEVNPYAKLTDWFLGLIASAIVANIVLIATIGVRLY